MFNILKRYSIALLFLALVAVLMALGTLGVTKFGNQMIADTDMHMKPRGESLNQ